MFFPVFGGREVRKCPPVVSGFLYVVHKYPDFAISGVEESKRRNKINIIFVLMLQGKLRKN